LPAKANNFEVTFGIAAEWHILPFDCGLSASRNFLVDATTRDLVILEDDFFFTGDTNIAAMQQILAERPDIGVVCGDAEAYGTTPMCFGNDGRLTPCRSDMQHTSGNVPYRLCDIADNFLLVRRQVFDDGIRWNPELKTGEHRDFFEKVKASGWKVAFTPASQIGHDTSEDSREYQTYRSRCCKHHRAIRERERGLSGQRLIVVLGERGSGCSCVAGMLHSLGVSMGNDCDSPDLDNPTGRFESRSLADAILTSQRERVAALKRWAAIRGQGVIGAKHSGLIDVVSEVCEAWPEAWLVCVGNVSVEDRPYLHVPYRQCIDAPLTIARLLANYAGITPDQKRLQAAANHPRSDLVDWKRALEPSVA